MNKRNTKQTNKATSKTASKTTKATTSAATSEADQVKAALDNAKDSIKKTIDESTTKATDKVTETTKTKSQSPASRRKSPAKTTEKTTVDTKKESTTTTKVQATKQEASPKQVEKQSSAQPSKQPIKKAPAEKKSGGLGTSLALLLGLAGTGLGAYSFNELRLLKSNTGNSAVTEQLTTLESKVSALGEGGATAEVKKQLAALSAQGKTLQGSEEKFNARITKVEQMQNGLGQSVKADVEKALDSRMAAVDTLLAKVKEIELSQQGLSKNLTEVSAVGSAVSAEGMDRQEVGYLLRMANYKIQSEGDVSGATGLLKIAESKLLAGNGGVADPLVESIREKLIQLSGVSRVDENALLSGLKGVSASITQLSIKSTSAATESAETGKTETTGGVFNQITSVIASGVKYTPNDPSKIDISAETALIEKRLLQTDVKTAELAVRSRNKVLLASSIQSIKDSMVKYFAADAVAAEITQTLDSVAQSELDTVLPDLSGLVSQFENNQ